MASIEAAINVVVKGSNAVNRLIDNVAQLQSIMDRVSNRPLNVSIGEARREINASVSALEEYEKQLKKIGIQERALEKSRVKEINATNATIADLIKQQSNYEKQAEKLQKQLDKRVASGNLKPENNSATYRKLTEGISAASAAAKDLSVQINQANQSVQNFGKDASANLRRQASELAKQRRESLIGLIDSQEALRGANSVSKLAKEFLALGDSLKSTSSETAISRRIPKQISEFKKLSREIDQTSLDIARLKAELESISDIEIAAPQIIGNIEIPLSTEDIIKNQQAKIASETRSNLQKTINEKEAELDNLNSRLDASAKKIQFSQALYSKAVSQRTVPSGLSVSLNQIQAQAEALALVANNSEIASTAFNRFTVAAQVASVKLARAQQNSFAALAAGFSSQAQNIPTGLKGAQAAGARSLVAQAIADIPTLTKSEAALGQHIGLLSQLKSIVPFLSDEYTVLTDAIARLNNELQEAQRLGAERGAGGPGVQRLTGMTVQQQELARAQGPFSLLPQFSIESEAKRLQFNRKIEESLERQDKLLVDIETSSLDIADKARLRLELDKATSTLAETSSNTNKTALQDSERILKRTRDELNYLKQIQAYREKIAKDKAKLDKSLQGLEQKPVNPFGISDKQVKEADRNAAKSQRLIETTIGLAERLGKARERVEESISAGLLNSSQGEKILLNVKAAALAIDEKRLKVASALTGDIDKQRIAAERINRTRIKDTEALNRKLEEMEKRPGQQRMVPGTPFDFNPFGISEAQQRAANKKASTGGKPSGPSSPINQKSAVIYALESAKLLEAKLLDLKKRGASVDQELLAVRNAISAAVADDYQNTAKTLSQLTQINSITGKRVSTQNLLLSAQSRESAVAEATKEALDRIEQARKKINDAQKAGLINETQQQSIIANLDTADLAVKQKKLKAANSITAEINKQLVSAQKLNETEKENQRRATADAWKMRGGPALPPGYETKNIKTGQFSPVRGNVAVEGALRSAAILEAKLLDLQKSGIPVNEDLLNLQKAINFAKNDDYQNTAKSLQQLLDANLFAGTRLKMEQYLVNSQNTEIDNQNRIRTSLLDLNALAKRYAIEQGKGVTFLDEQSQLQKLINSTSTDSIAINSKNAEILEHNTSYFRSLLSLRVLEAKAAGKYESSASALNTPEKIEKSRAQLLSKALAVQASLTKLETSGVDIANEKLQVEASILRLKELQGKASSKEIESIAQQLLDISNIGKELKNAIPQKGKGAGFVAALPAEEVRKEYNKIVSDLNAVPVNQTAEAMRKLGNISKLTNNQLEELEQRLTELRNKADATGTEFRQLTRDLARINRQQERRDPNADFLTRQFGSRGAQAISEGLIGGAFPLLFGQGAGASLGGLVGGGAGGFIGGNLGFGLSLLGTALGSVFDQLNQAAQETGKSLNYPIEGFEKLKEAGLFASRQQEYYISKLIESGRTIEATAQIQAEMIRKIGVTGVNDLMRLDDASLKLSKAWAEFNLQLQAALAGPLAGLLNWLTEVLSIFNQGTRDATRIQDIRSGLSEKDKVVFDKKRLEISKELTNPFSKFSYEDLAKRELLLAEQFAGRSRPVQPKSRQQSFEEQEKAIESQRRVADEIKSAYREGFQLQQKQIDFERKIVDMRRKLEDDIFNKRQDVLRQEIDNARKLTQIVIDRIDLEFQKKINNEEGIAAEVLSAQAAAIKSRLEGEANIATQRKLLELDIAKQQRETQNYIFNLSREADSIRRETLSMEMEVEDYRLKISRQIENERRIAAAERSAGAAEGGAANVPIVADIAAKWLTAEQKALNATIRFAEGTAGKLGYQTLFGGGIFTVLSRHPNKVVRANGYSSAAAGAYQFMPDTWQLTGGGAMTPERQDAASVFLQLRRKADIRKEAFSPAFVEKLAPEWASFPTRAGGSYYKGQPAKKYAELKAVYDRNLQYYRQQEKGNWNAGMTGANWPAGVPRPGTPAGQGAGASRGTTVNPGAITETERQLEKAASQVIKRPVITPIPVSAYQDQYANLAKQDERAKRTALQIDTEAAAIERARQLENMRVAARGSIDLKQRREAAALAKAELLTIGKVSQNQQERALFEAQARQKMLNLEDEIRVSVQKTLADTRLNTEEIEATIRGLVERRHIAREQIKLDREALDIAQKRRFIESRSALERQLFVVGTGAQAGYFGAGASAYEAEMQQSQDPAKAAAMAQLTRAIEVKQMITNLQDELNALIDPINQVTGAAGAIGSAFSKSFRDAISGSVSAQQALANFFQQTADHFLDMASQIMAKWIQLAILNSVLKLLPGGMNWGQTPGIDTFGSMDLPGLGGAGALGNGLGLGNGIGVPVTGFANGGMFTNSIVKSPTLFQFADGGAFSAGVMGEAGPEAVMPLSRGPGGRLGVDASGSGNVSVTVNVDARGTSVEGNDERGKQLGRVVAAAVQAELVNQKRRGGILNN